jgi:2-oxoglutarate dehydrogenase E2 component (dihydrolipoamide succinyltransferase)
MTIEIRVPSPGESVTEGVLSAWLKKNGEYVQVDEPVYELESDKATKRVPAPGAGILQIDVPEGQTVQVGSVVGRIDEKAGPGASPKAAKVPAKPAPAAAPAQPPAAAPPVPPPAPSTAPPARLSPSARHLVAEKGIDPGQLTGSGRDGLITKEDVLAHLAEAQPVPPPLSAALPPGPSSPAATPAPVAAAARETRKRMSTIRQRIAERLVAAQQNAAILTTFNEADLSAVMTLRSRYKDNFQKKYGVGLGFMSFFVKACVEALRAFPEVNASIDGSDIVYHNYHDIGVAVSTERGLMVPVLRDADKLSFAGIEQGIAELAKKAREEKISVADLQGGTFTITNGGVFGSLLSTPILNPPQSAILGMHAIQKRPVVVAEQVVVRPMMYLALSYDHRLVDGREAVSFLVRVKECVENPERLLLEV